MLDPLGVIEGVERIRAELQLPAFTEHPERLLQSPVSSQVVHFAWDFGAKVGTPSLPRVTANHMTGVYGYCKSRSGCSVKAGVAVPRGFVNAFITPSGPASTLTTTVQPTRKASSAWITGSVQVAACSLNMRFVF